VTGGPLDLGHGHTLTWAAWQPDRELNPQYEGIPDCEFAQALIKHPRPDGSGECLSGIIPDRAPAAVISGRPTWHVESWEPLTLSPSVLCLECGDHGFIRSGHWVPA
jgi:hypothetical protein